MHVALVEFEWHGHYTAYPRRLSSHLLDLGHEVTLFTPGNNPHLDEFPESPDLTIVRVEPAVERRLPVVNVFRSQARKARQLSTTFSKVRQRDVDLVHVLSLETMHLPFFVANKSGGPGCPVVGTVHRADRYDEAFLDATVKVYMGRVFDGLGRKAMEHALSSGHLERAIVPTDRIGRRLRRKVDGLESGRLETLELPPPKVAETVSREESRRRLDLPVDSPILLFFGELRHQKGPDLLVEALEGLDREYTVVFAGKSVEYDESTIAAWRDRIEPEGRFVTRLEYIPEEEVESYFTAADLLVLPYRRERAITGTINWAAVTDTHVVAADDSDVGDYVEDNGFGQTFARGSAAGLRETIETYLDSPDDYPTEELLEYDATRWKDDAERLYADCL